MYSNGERRGLQRTIKFVVATVLAWSLIVFDQRLGNATSELRGAIASWLVAPVRYVARLPSQTWDATSTYFKSRQELISATQQLQEELLRERTNRQQIEFIERENVRLRVLLDSVKPISPKPIVAEVINTSSLPYINRIVLSKGRNQGIQDNQGIFNEQGVIGQLTRVDSDTSQALLLTDKRFWVATRVRRNGLLILLQGDGGRDMRGRFVPADVEIQIGDVLVTAGGEGPFPAGIPVAKIVASWSNTGESFKEVQVVPIASVRQDSALLINSITDEQFEATLENLAENKEIIPANFNPEVLP